MKKLLVWTAVAAAIVFGMKVYADHLEAERKQAIYDSRKNLLILGARAYAANDNLAPAIRVLLPEFPISPMALDNATLCDDPGEEPQIIAEAYVTYNLLAPSTASFNENPVVSRDGSCVYSVRSWVDAQNGFGVMIRKHFTITMRFDQDKGGWVNVASRGY